MMLLSRSLAAFLALAGATMLTACAGSSYMGISLKPGAADPAVQEMAQRARSGDKQAQLELGIRFEEGSGVDRDLQRACSLFRMAASDSGKATTVYVPGVGGAGGRVMHVGGDEVVAGLIDAQLRLEALANSCRLTSALPAAVTESRKVEFANNNWPAEADFVNALGEIDNEPCRRAIDICDTPAGLLSYEINILGCHQLSSIQSECTVQDIRANVIFRTCVIQMGRDNRNGTEIWAISRGRRGDEPRALLVSCDNI